MEYQRFGNTLYVRLDRGEEILESLKKLSLAEDIRLAEVRGLGATDDFTVGVYDVDKRQFLPLTFTGPHEIVSLTGTVNTMDGAYYSHLHMSAGDIRGQVKGGHLSRCRISATAELVITVTEGTVDRRHDEAVTGLNLFAFPEGKTL